MHEGYKFGRYSSPAQLYKPGLNREFQTQLDALDISRGTKTKNAWQEQKSKRVSLVRIIFTRTWCGEMKFPSIEANLLDKASD